MSAYIKSKIREVRFENALLLIGALASILWAVYFSVVTITIPYQIELREGSAQVVTRILLSGENPYIFENQPLAINVYGLGYNLAVLPFARLFGNTLAVYRSVTFAFIVLASALAFASVYKIQKDVSLALACAAFVMTALIARAGNGAFSSAMGVFLFLAVLLIPYFRSFDYPSLVLSAFLALAAFYTKPYFVLSFGILASFLFLFVSKKKGMGYAFLFLALFVTAFLVVRLAFPLYFFNVIVVNIFTTLPSYAYLLDQLSVLLFYFYPLLLLAILLLVINRNESQLGTDQKKFLDISKWQFPLIQREFDYHLYLFACSLFAFLFILGPHQGNYLNYAYQLLVPTFCCWFFQKFDFRKGLKIIAVMIVLFNLFVWEGAWLAPSMLEQKNSTEWAKFYSHVRSAANILNSQVETSEVVRLGLIPIDAGPTIVYYEIKPFADNILMDASYEAVFADGVKYTNLVDRSIERQRFDMIIQVEEKGTFYHVKELGKYYSLIDEISLDMPQAGQHWTMLIWKPTPK